MKSYDGSLQLSVKDNWLLLRDARGAMVGRRGLKTTDSFSIGAKLSFPNHVVRLGTQWKFAKASASSSSLPKKDLLQGHVIPPEVMLKEHDKNNNSTADSECGSSSGASSFANSVHASLFMGLNFSHGINFAKDVKNKFNVDVHPSPEVGQFSMVVSFGRANFRMEEDLVSIALEAVIGGFCGELKVTLLRDRVFSFCVSTKEVGFHILKMRRFACAQFKCFFHLWGRGGPNWRWEFKNWQMQCDADWILVSPPRGVVKKGLAALQKKAGRSIIAKSHNSAKKSLNFASEISYEACKGYSNPTIGPDVPVESATQETLPEGQNVQGNVMVGPDEQANGDDDFQKMIDDMAYKVWTCGRCLNMGHSTADCTNDIRC
jgi:hypothetical protein